MAAQWLDKLKTAVNLYNEGDFSGCIAHINTVFRDTTPGYPRTRYYALLAFCTDNWREAETSSHREHCPNSILIAKQ
jgi:hypothetical protein